MVHPDGPHPRPGQGCRSSLETATLRPATKWQGLRYFWPLSCSLAQGTRSGAADGRRLSVGPSSCRELVAGWPRCQAGSLHFEPLFCPNVLTPPSSACVSRARSPSFARSLDLAQRHRNSPLWARHFLERAINLSVSVTPDCGRKLGGSHWVQRPPIPITGSRRKRKLHEGSSQPTRRSSLARCCMKEPGILRGRFYEMVLRNEGVLRTSCGDGIEKTELTPAFAVQC